MSETENTIPQNQFKPFATSANSIVQTQEDYEKSAALKEGFRKGLARSNEVNKALRQATSIAAAVAGFTAEKSEQDILDNGDIDTLKQQFETAIRTISATLSAEAEGEADVLTATFTPTLKHLTTGKTVLVRAKQKNTSKTPSFQADQTGAKPIVKGNNLPLEESDIAGAGHWLELQFDQALDKWVLQNPAKGISPLNGVPVGTVEYFSMPTPPAGYLKADGRAVGRETYAELYSVIGTTFGEGDGQTSFNLPDLIDRFAQGSAAPGQKVEAGLPNVTGNASNIMVGTNFQSTGAFSTTVEGVSPTYGGTTSAAVRFNFSADKSNPIYGTSNTVQPPALTLLPCVKAFDAASNPGLIDITGLANEVDGKLDRVIDSKPVRYVIDAYNDGTNWYRKWSDGWLEQGGAIESKLYGTASLLVPFATANYIVVASQQVTQNIDSRAVVKTKPDTATTFLLEAISISAVASQQVLTCNYYATGLGVQS
ncbi:tail fiber protein [Oxalobacter formigenes]